MTLESRLCLAGTLVILLLGGGCTTFHEVAFNGLIIRDEYTSIPAIKVGDPICGSFFIDPTVLTGVGERCAGVANCWSGEGYGWNVTSGTVEYSFPGSDYSTLIIEFIDSVPGSGHDVVKIRFSNGWAHHGVIELIDPSGMAIDSNEFANVDLLKFPDGKFLFEQFFCVGADCALAPHWLGEMRGLSQLHPD